MAGTLEQRMETFLATGNAPSNNVTLAQYKGLTIVAENINRMRYMSHFKELRELQAMNLQAKAQDRLWRSLVSEAKTHFGSMRKRSKKYFPHCCVLKWLPNYSGYDMEDAMIINKSAYERGFAAGFVYKSDFIELKHSSSYFWRDPARPELVTHIDEDGLPAVGARVQPEDPLYCFYDGEKSQFVVSKYHGKEEVVVDSVRLCGDFSARAPRKACIMLRIQRNPTVGDKFASRAGQKGICSQLWPAEDLPFSESGLIPDILFNPHGFPSRMTIAMMIECMAGKAASLHGHVSHTVLVVHATLFASNFFG
ncbi:DNA-directed RNA polymerase I subunit RPA2 [Papilio xuthus]|uniref:DNA-directed RNA polymerase n=1 Tax=Papilio xuthus TaxID=66420 RepID=A0A0N0P9Z1_PAPXU|nr:DNA-directed RNA polymerase I subunit RPA2 [Papilio xuthus]